MRALAVAVLLAACSGGDDGGPDAGACPGPDPSTCHSCEECFYDSYYVCDEASGEWRPVPCEPPYASVNGTWTLTQTISTASESCPALAPRDPLALVVDELGAVSADPPITIVEATAQGDYLAGSLNAIVTDEWQGVTVTIDYRLGVDPAGAAGGNGWLSIDTCTAILEVTGTLTSM